MTPYIIGVGREGGIYGVLKLKAKRIIKKEEIP